MASRSDLDPEPGYGEDPPLVAGMIHGLRRWSIAFDEEGNGRLQGFNGIRWEEGGAPTVADCAGGWSPSHHRAPGHSCQCGLYGCHPDGRSATEVFPDDFDYLEGTMQISGLVEAWGRIELHLNGFRAQYARPVALILRREYAEGHLGGLEQDIARAHGAEVLVLGEPRELEEYCRAHGLGMDPATVAELLRAEAGSPERQLVSGSGGGTLGARAGRSPRVRSDWQRVVYAGRVWRGGSVS
jgi:hypothetical protein